MIDDQQVIRQFELYKEQLFVRHSIPLGIRQNMAISSYLDSVIDSMVYQLSTYVAADRAALERITYPATWVDAILQRWVPDALQRRFEFLCPNLTTHTIKTNYIYPNLELPQDDSRYVRVAVVDSYRSQALRYTDDD